MGHERGSYTPADPGQKFIILFWTISGIMLGRNIFQLYHGMEDSSRSQNQIDLNLNPSIPLLGSMSWDNLCKASRILAATLINEK